MPRALHAPLDLCLHDQGVVVLPVLRSVDQRDRARERPGAEVVEDCGQTYLYFSGETGGANEGRSLPALKP